MIEHGKRSTFVNHECRCLPCRVANALYQAPRKRMIQSGEWQGLRSSARAQRMIKRLMIEGFTKNEIARRMGQKNLRLKPKIRWRTERKIEAFFNYYVREAA